MTEIRWEDPPRATSGRGPAPDPELLAFAEALRAEPKRWAVWPRSYSERTRPHNVASMVRKGKYASLGAGFEACVRLDAIYVRYVGTDEIET